MANTIASAALHLKTELELNQQLTREFLATGVSMFDDVAGGIPRGAMTEIYGPASSGKTSFLHTFITTATLQGEFCALVDAANSFDPHSCARADLRRLLWVRCTDAVQALKSCDLLVHSGGWGVIILDLGDIPPPTVRRLPISYWYRFRRSVENTPTAFLVIESEPFVKNCAAMTVEIPGGRSVWSGRHRDFKLLRGVNVRVAPRKPVGAQTCAFEAKALA
jgi:hypothetical protein